MATMKQKSSIESTASATGLLRAAKLCEELRDLLFVCSHELAKVGGANWHKAEELFRLAKSADALREGVAGLIIGEQGEAQGGKILHQDVIGVTALESREPRINTAAALRAARKKKNEYPKYSVRGDLLVKTGLSRNARSEYEHIVPKKEFDTILAILTELSASKKPFAVEDIQSRLDCPNYQTYTVLALLKSRNLLLVPRRGFYSFKSAKNFAVEAANLWEESKTS